MTGVVDVDGEVTRTEELVVGRIEVVEVEDVGGGNVVDVGASFAAGEGTLAAAGGRSPPQDSDTTAHALTSTPNVTDTTLTRDLIRTSLVEGHPEYSTPSLSAMAASGYLDHLSSIRLFSSCSQRDLTKIARATDELTVPAGRVLVEQGGSGREAFVIVDGEAAVSINGTTVVTLGPGKHFGELALLDGGPRTATVTALTDLTVLVIHQRAFLSLIDEVPGLARKIMTSLAGMVRELDEQVNAAG